MRILSSMNFTVIAVIICISGKEYVCSDLVENEIVKENTDQTVANSEILTAVDEGLQKQIINEIGNFKGQSEFGDDALNQKKREIKARYNNKSDTQIKMEKVKRRKAAIKNRNKNPNYKSAKTTPTKIIGQHRTVNKPKSNRQLKIAQVIKNDPDTSSGPVSFSKFDTNTNDSNSNKNIVPYFETGQSPQLRNNIKKNYNYKTTEENMEAIVEHSCSNANSKLINADSTAVLDMSNKDYYNKAPATVKNEAGAKHISDFLDSNLEYRELGKPYAKYVIFIILGIITFALYIFVFLPKLSSRIRENLCCCVPFFRLQKENKFGIIILLLSLIGFGTAAIFFAMFSNIETASFASGAHSTFCSATSGAYVLLYGGINSLKNVDFGGLKNIKEDIELLGKEFDPNNVDNLMNDVQNVIVATDAFDAAYASLTDELNAIKFTLTEADIVYKTAFHKAISYDIIITEIDLFISDFDANIAAAFLSLNNDIESAFNNTGNFYENSKVFGDKLNDIIIVLEDNVDILNDYYHYVTFMTSISKYVPLAFYIFLYVMSGLIILISVMTLISRGPMQFRKAATAGVWNLLFIVSTLFFILGGVFFIIMEPTLDVCAYTYRELVLAENFDQLDSKFSVTNGLSSITDIASTCLKSTGNGDLLNSLNIPINATATQATRDDFDAILSGNAPTIDLTPISTMVANLKDTAPVALVDITLLDPTIPDEQRSLILPSVIDSGVENDDRVIANAADYGLTPGYTVSGLSTLAFDTQPWGARLLQENTPRDSFMITGSYPIKGINTNFDTWLSIKETDVFNLYILAGNSAAVASTRTNDHMEKFVNTVWWTSKHQYIREYISYKCYTNATDFYLCDWDTMQTHISTLADEVALSAAVLESEIIDCFDVIESDTSALVYGILDDLDAIAVSSNCSFVRHVFLLSIDAACSYAAYHGHSLAFMWACLACATVMIALGSALLWHSIIHWNDTLPELYSRNSNSKQSFHVPTKNESNSRDMKASMSYIS